MRSLRSIWVLAACLAMLVTACGGGNGEPDAGATDLGGEETTGGEGAEGADDAPEDVLQLTQSSIRAIPNLPAILAPEYADQFGLEIEDIPVTNPADSITALVRGDTDLFFATPSTAIAARDQGQPLVVISGGARGSTQLILASDLEIPEGDWDALRTAVEEAKAEGDPLRFGAATGASTNFVECYFELQGEGIDPDEDLEIVSFPNFPEHPAALERGEMEILCTPDPFATLSINSGAGTFFALPYSTDAGDQLGAIMSTEEIVESKTEALTRYVQTLQFAIDEIDRDPSIAIDAVTNMMDVDAETAEQMLEHTSWSTDLVKSEIEALARMHHELGQTDRDWSCCVDEYVNTQFVDALE